MHHQRSAARKNLWDERYSADMPDWPEPCDCLKRYHSLLPATGRGLDLASGRGGNALFLATVGLEAHAWDQSAVALQQCESFAAAAALTVQTKVVDVVTNPPQPQSFDAVVVSRFLDRSVMPDILDALKPDGLLFYQTFVVGNRNGPKNPDFLLKPNELLRLVDGLRIKVYLDAGHGDAEITSDSGLEQHVDRALLSDEAMVVAQKKSG